MRVLKASVRRQLAFWLGLTLSAVAVSSPSLQSSAEVLSQLRSGGLVIVMRHASAPADRPDSAHADAANPGHERQLDESGRLAAQTMGAAIRALNIPIGSIQCSPTYRARETVRLTALGAPVIEPQLDEIANGMLAATDSARARWLRDQASVSPMARTNRLLVTHQPNILDAFPQIGAPPQQGEALIFKPDGHGGAQLIYRVQMTDWLLLKTP